MGSWIKKLRRLRYDRLIEPSERRKARALIDKYQYARDKQKADLPTDRGGLHQQALRRRYAAARRRAADPGRLCRHQDLLHADSRAGGVPGMMLLHPSF